MYVCGHGIAHVCVSVGGLCVCVVCVREIVCVGVCEVVVVCFGGLLGSYMCVVGL